MRKFLPMVWPFICRLQHGLRLFLVLMLVNPLKRLFQLRRDSPVIAFVALLVFISQAMRLRGSASSGRKRIFWGPRPLINIKFISQGLKELGMDSTTCVSQHYATINQKEDFDLYIGQYVESSPSFSFLSPKLRAEFRDYLFFFHALSEFDIFNYNFNSGLLVETPLRHVEIPLIRLADKYCVLMGYGADVQHTLFSRNFLFKHAYNLDYPQHVRKDSETRKGVLQDCLDAHFTICSGDFPDFLPFWDAIWSGYYPSLDCEEFSPERYPTQPRSPGDDSIRILHAPNHRNLKGTAFLETACQELQAEGLKIELIIIEKLQNTQLRQLISDVDIVADQFIVGWHGMFAIEAMALEKPVLCYLRPDLVEVHSLYSCHGECPLVNTPPDRIKENIRLLANDEGLRRSLGARGRAFTLKYCSHEKAALHFKSLYESLPLPHDQLNKNRRHLIEECFRRFFRTANFL